MEAQSGVVALPRLASTASMKRYWPICVMTLLMLTCWIPYFIRQKADAEVFLRASQEKLEVIDNKRFTNETVEIDGKEYRHCTFTNATLMFHGRGGSSIHDNRFYGTLVISSDRASIAAFAELLAFTGAFDARSARWEETTDGVVKVIRQFPAAPIPATQ